MVFNSVQERFAAQVARTPDLVAVSSGDARLTYRQLDERANRLAHRLIGLGVRPEDPVAVLLERSIHLPVAILATLKAGGLYLPLHGAAPLQRMQRIMDDAGGPVLLADEVTRERDLPAGGPLVFVDSDSQQLTLPAAFFSMTTSVWVWFVTFQGSVAPIFAKASLCPFPGSFMACPQRRPFSSVYASLKPKPMRSCSQNLTCACPRTPSVPECPLLPFPRNSVSII